mmetsp:Transcript_94287/g.148303  ORF Transcript_94287/g.148303 Transcript_94287/m.148303 type:complete len:1557 (-) Transcript_94287:76-4746(-)
MRSGTQVDLNTDPFATRVDVRRDVTKDKLKQWKWEELTDQEQQDWMNLGWEQLSWDYREIDKKPPPPYTKSFKQLTPRQQESALRSGYAPETWDTNTMHMNQPGKAGGGTWDDLPGNTKYLWVVLGWDAERWQRGDAPPSWSKDWNDLSEREQDAARNLGYSAKTWKGETTGRNKKWNELGENDRMDWKKLGYGEDSWNRHMRPQTMSMPWAQLNEDQRIAARNLGYSSSSWDKQVATAANGWAELADYADGIHDPIEEWYHHYRADGKRPMDTRVEYAPDGTMIRREAATVWTPKGVLWASARFDDVFMEHPNLRPVADYSLATHEQLLLIPDLELASAAEYIVHYIWTVKGFEWARPIWGKRKPPLKAGSDVTEEQWLWLRQMSEDVMAEKYIKQKKLTEREIEEINRFRLKDPTNIGLSSKDRLTRGWFAGHTNRNEQEAFAMRNLEILQNEVTKRRLSSVESRDVRWTNDPKVFPLPASVTGEYSEMPSWEGGILPYPPHMRQYFVPQEPRPGTKSLTVFIGRHRHVICDPPRDPNDRGRHPERNIGVAKPPPYGNDYVWLACTIKGSPQYFETPVIDGYDHREWNTSFTFENFEDDQVLMFFICCKSGDPRGPMKSRHLFTGMLKWKDVAKHLGQSVPVTFQPVEPGMKVARGARKVHQGGCFDLSAPEEYLPDHTMTAVVHVVVDVMKAPKIQPTWWQKLNLGNCFSFGEIKTMSDAKAHAGSYCLNVHYTTKSFEQLEHWKYSRQSVVLAAGTFYQDGPMRLLDVSKFQDEFNGGETSLFGGEASILIKVDRPVRYDHPKGTTITLYDYRTFHPHDKRVDPDVDRVRRIQAGEQSKYVWTLQGVEMCRLEGWHLQPEPRRGERVTPRQQAVIINQLGMQSRVKYDSLAEDQKLQVMENLVSRGAFQVEPNYVWTRSGLEWASYQEQFLEAGAELFPVVKGPFTVEHHEIIRRNDDLKMRDPKNLEAIGVLEMEEYYDTKFIRPPPELYTHPEPQYHLTPRRHPSDNPLMSMPWSRLTDFGHAAAERGFAVVFDNTDPEKSNCGRVFQGELDNAYFVEALNAISCRPKLAKQLFYCWDVEKAIFILRINVNGTWVRVEVDDYIPPRMTTSEEADGLAAKPSCCYSENFPFVLWPSLVEKAYAKAHTARPPYGFSGGWESLGGGGRVEEALADLTGGVAGRFSTSDVSSDRLFLYFYHLQRYCIWVARPSQLACRKHGVNLDLHTAYVVNRAETYNAECYVQLFSACPREQTGGAGLETYSVPTELVESFPERKSGEYFWVNILDFYSYFDTVFECRLTNSPDVSLPGMPAPRLPQEKLTHNETTKSNNLPETGIFRNRGGADGPYLFFEHIWANAGIITPHTDPEFEIVVPDGACPCEVVAVAQQRTPRTDQVGSFRDEPVAVLLKVYQHVEGNCYCGVESRDGGYRNIEPFARSNFIPIRDAMVCFNAFSGGKFLITCELQLGSESHMKGLVFRAYTSVPAVTVKARVSHKKHKLVVSDEVKCLKWSLVGCKNPGHRLNDKAPESYNPASDGLSPKEIGATTNQQCSIM